MVLLNNYCIVSFCINRKDKPYCETCYHDSFGVMCSSCGQFITGKVLEVGTIYMEWSVDCESYWEGGGGMRRGELITHKWTSRNGMSLEASIFMLNFFS